MYKYTNKAGEIEEEDYFLSETLDLFTPVSTTLLPTWFESAVNHHSQILASMAKYNPSVDQLAPGSILLQVKEGILPFKNSSWYLGYTHDDDNFDVKIAQGQMKMSDDIKLTVPLSHIIED